MGNFLISLQFHVNEPIPAPSPWAWHDKAEPDVVKQQILGIIHSRQLCPSHSPSSSFPLPLEAIQIPTSCFKKIIIKKKYLQTLPPHLISNITVNSGCKTSDFVSFTLPEKWRFLQGNTDVPATLRKTPAPRHYGVGVVEILGAN